MENRQTDSDAGVQSQVGVGHVERITKALHEVNPNWVDDGFGIVGPQRPVIPQPLATPHPMPFLIDNPGRGGAGTGDCTPTNPPGSGTFVWGTINGVCQWIDTTTC